VRILFITDYLPYPPISGDLIRVYNLVKRMARQHEVTLAAALWTPGDEESLRHLRGICHRVETGSLRWEHPLKFLPDLVRYALAGTPLELRFLYSDKLASAITQMVTEEDFDVVHIEQSRMALYLEAIPKSARCTRILAFQNIASDQYSRIAAIESRPVKKMRALLFSRMMRRWEPRYAERFDRCIAVSEEDRRQLMRANPRLPIDLVPNGVDIQSHQPLESGSTKPGILFIGSMGYPPCVDAILHFCQEILPLVEAAFGQIDVWVVGADPSPAVLDLASQSVHVTGQVESVKPYYERSSLAIVPLRAGGGTRLKILEAMALGRPVVSTSIGCEGLDVVDGRHILVADGVKQFADCIVRLLTDKALYQQLATEARKFVVMKYDWDLIASHLLDVYSKGMQGQAIPAERVPEVQV
jgi:polysaccharide biosynthesis protein PslH